MSAEFKSQNGTLRVLLCGEIDHHTARELCESIDLRIASAKPQVVLLDFSRVSFYGQLGACGRCRKKTNMRQNREQNIYSKHQRIPGENPAYGGCGQAD